jgi:hypothetical protein
MPVPGQSDGPGQLCVAFVALGVRRGVCCDRGADRNAVAEPLSHETYSMRQKTWQHGKWHTTCMECCRQHHRTSQERERSPRIRMPKVLTH